MRYRALGQLGIEVSTVGLGTWAIGGGPWWGSTDEREAIGAIHAALDGGVNLIDTAPAYGFGRSEEVVGKAIKRRREKIVLATKCGLWSGDARGSFFFELDGVTVRRSLRPDTIRLEVENSLRRLGTETIDLMQTHWQAVEPEKTPIGETMACLMQLKEEGKIRAIGVSNATIAEMEAYCGAGDLVACQPRYSMLDRTIEADLLPWCQQHEIATLVYSPLEQGLLTGNVSLDRRFGAQEFRNQNPWFTIENRQRVLEMLTGWRELTQKYACTLGQLVIAWTLAQPGVTSALCGARKSHDATENAAAGDLVLSTADLARMRQDAEALGEHSTASTAS